MANSKQINYLFMYLLIKLEESAFDRSRYYYNHGPKISTITRESIDFIEETLLVISR